MRILQSAFALVFLAFLMLSTASLTSANDKTEIDRNALIFFVEDELAASVFAERSQSLSFALNGALSWLDEAYYTNTGVGEALQHARVVHSQAESELLGLYQKLAGFPTEGPQFPPVFYWFDDWPDWQKASLDLMTLKAKHLGEIIDALAKGDHERAHRARLALDADGLAFQPYFDSIIDAGDQILPPGHPDRILSHAFGKWDTHATLVARRSDAADEADEAAFRDITLKIGDELHRMSRTIEQRADDLEASLEPYRDTLLPYVQVLTDDAVQAEEVVDRYMQTYVDAVEALRGVARVHSDTAAHELEVWRDSMTPELYAGYTEFQYRYKPLYKRVAQTWIERAQILVDAIAR